MPAQGGTRQHALENLERTVLFKLRVWHRMFKVARSLVRGYCGLMNRELVRCLACGRVHLQVPRDDVPEYEREQLECCCVCGSKEGFVQASLTNDEATSTLPVCIPSESPREAGVAIGLYEVSDAEVMRRIRKRVGTQ